VGFALETENEAENAGKKLRKKNFDFVVLNSLKDEGAGFKTDTNKVTYFFSDDTCLVTDLVPKKQIAVQIIDLIKNIRDKQEKE
jgi:phosphopantothenoylcysteine decarboxylase/phosphopantothenate--cysteine ligase